jgi:ADP-ribose pyrophosphatase
MSAPEPEPRVLHAGRFLELRSRGGWEYAARANASGVVGVLAVTPDREILLVEQFRPPVGKFVLELPAGLAGDEPLKEDEPLLAAARRELLEETGHEARRWFSLGDGPSSAGLTDETVTLFLALEVRPVRELEHFGVGNERIRLHRVRIAEVPDFLARSQRDGIAVDFKIAAALYLAQRHPMLEA